MEKVRIQDDLFTYVNQETLDKLVIPDDKPTAGGFQVLADDVEKLMIGEFKHMSKTKEFPNEYLKNACTLFQIVKNVKRRDKEGMTPALKNVTILDKAKDMKSFSRAYKALKLKKIPLPFSISVDTDMKDSKNCKDCKDNIKETSNVYDDGNIPQVDLPQDVIPDEVPRKDGPGGESGK